MITPASVRAQDAEDAEILRNAKEHYKLGLDAFKTGRYPDAKNWPCVIFRLRSLTATKPPYFFVRCSVRIIATPIVVLDGLAGSTHRPCRMRGFAFPTPAT